ncbi:putative cytochrome p450 monooxygenase protein [Botrytis fragariae]|uniref:Putative cytochrome p450 monooxygenase protein n=1 Tax=Botrytis fragariae TaxID=1964551 RepID=A0A8H6EEA7_9HELO|nr:putative cytochrome p450 monooxygenase protein [Botrytis fragariae]KAF5869159.1 putative cytochrome p450 monooxygenase protein [Botrytis fragariae]
MLSVAALAAFLYLLYTLISTLRVLYFHSLSHIPGPTLWIAFPIFRHLSLIRGRQDIELRALHQKYGEVVRFAPDEVSFITAQAWRDIYGHGHKQLPKFKHSAANPLDIINSNDVDHSRYRKAMSHAFSAKGLQAQEPILKRYVDKLVTRLEHEAKSRLPVDMVKWYNLTTFDLIGDLAFGESFGGLENSQYHFWVSTIFESVRAIQFAKVKDVYPMFFQLIKPFMRSGLANARQRQQDYSKAVVQTRLANPEPSDLVDFMDSMLRHRGEKDGLSDEELVANSSILVIAGSETTATLLSGVTFLLLKNPVAMKKLTDEVRTAMQSEEDITFANATANLPYMLACLEEALRRYPPVGTGLQRVTTSTTIISGYEVPPNTRVAVHQFAAYHSPLNFHKPECYIPERWLPEAKNDPQSPFFNDNRDVLQPFSVGPRNCIGRNLAYNEMRVILARIIWRFDLELCPESQAWDDQKSYILWEKPELMCKLTPREY